MTVIAKDDDIATSTKMMTESKSGEIDEIEFYKVLDEFEDMLTDIPGCCANLTTDIKLEEGSQPFALYLYKIPNHLKQGVKEELDHLVAQGKIEDSNAEWSSPIVPVVNGTAKV